MPDEDGDSTIIRPGLPGRTMQAFILFLTGYFFLWPLWMPEDAVLSTLTSWFVFGGLGAGLLLPVAFIELAGTTRVTVRESDDSIERVSALGHVWRKFRLVVPRDAITGVTLGQREETRGWEDVTVNRVALSLDLERALELFGYRRGEVVLLSAGGREGVARVLQRRVQRFLDRSETAP